MDDPSEVLNAAGVEFALDPDGEVDLPRFDDYGDAAIRAVALLAAKYKWQRDEACEFVAGYANRAFPHDPPLTAADVLADIDAFPC